jgi:hypothetical protein
MKPSNLCACAGVIFAALVSACSKITACKYPRAAHRVAHWLQRLASIPEIPVNNTKTVTAK